jgi:hypothetical protein
MDSLLRWKTRKEWWTTIRRHDRDAFDVPPGGAARAVLEIPERPERTSIEFVNEGVEDVRLSTSPDPAHYLTIRPGERRTFAGCTGAFFASASVDSLRTALVTVETFHSIDRQETNS